MSRVSFCAAACNQRGRLAISACNPRIPIVHMQRKWPRSSTEKRAKSWRRRSVAVSKMQMNAAASRFQIYECGGRSVRWNGKKVRIWSTNSSIFLAEIVDFRK